MDATALNQQLALAYHEALDGFRGFPAVEGQQSAPLLVQVPEAYSCASCRLMIVGQQTDGWGDGYDPSDVAALMHGYAEFNLGGSQRRTPFWKAAHTLYRLLNPTAPPNGFLWSNLAKVDVARGRPPRGIWERLLEWRLLPTEIRITQPDAVVFFTGPNYDQWLVETFPGTRLEQVAQYIDRVTNADGHLPVQAYRVYHPKFLRMRRHWNVLDELANTIRAASMGTSAADSHHAWPAEEKVV